MITRLHPNDNEEQKVHRYIIGLTHAIQDEFYLFLITTMHEAMAKTQKAEFKLKTIPSIILELQLPLLLQQTLLHQVQLVHWYVGTAKSQDILESIAPSL